MSEYCTILQEDSAVPVNVNAIGELGGTDTYIHCKHTSLGNQADSIILHQIFAAEESRPDPFLHLGRKEGAASCG